MSTVLTQQAYPASTVISASVPWTAGATGVSATPIMANADSLNSANKFTFAIAASYDPLGLTFVRESISGWQGGLGVASSFWGPGKIPTFVRIEIDLPQALSIGADLVMQ